MKQFLLKTYALLDRRVLKEIELNKSKLKTKKNRAESDKGLSHFTFDPFWGEFYKRDKSSHEQLVFLFLGSLAISESLEAYEFYEKLTIKVIKKMIKKNNLSPIDVTEFFLSSIRKNQGTH